MQRGERIHAWLAQISWIEDGLPTVAELLSTTGALGDAEEAERLLAQIREPSSPLHRIFSKPTLPGAELWRERRFAVMDATDQSAELLTGTFDRVVLWRNADGTAKAAQIIDFKTDPFASETDRQRLEERYRPQLAAYRRALRLLVPALKEVEVSLGLIGAE
jgi:ATP-dependent helicase/nuclease subunit A